MNQLTEIRRLAAMLLDEMPEYRLWAAEFGQGEEGQRSLLRALMNLRPPKPIDPAFLEAQDRYLRQERRQAGIVEAAGLPVTAADPRLALWQGDITRMRADAIVNAANSGLLGCFHPLHGCIDNAIHSAAGIQLRLCCHQIMERQGHEEPAGQAKLTPGFNLPARYVLHTVGPIVRGTVTAQDRAELAACYRACLRLAAENRLESLAFCCISTGEFRFPHRAAAEIAVETVKEFLKTPSSVQRVIFNVFQDADKQIYRQLLGPDAPAEGAAGPG